MPRLTREQAEALEALHSDPDHIAYQALQAGDQGGRLDALQLWTTWRRDEAAELLNRPRLYLVTRALIAGLHARIGRRLGRGERRTFDLLARLYAEASGILPLEVTYEARTLRVCERCDLVTRGPRNASRCPDCGHRHSARINEEPPQFTPCPVCGISPVTGAQVRCEACKAERTKARKAAQAMRRRARQRGTADRP